MCAYKIHITILFSLFIGVSVYLMFANGNKSFLAKNANKKNK